MIPPRRHVRIAQCSTPTILSNRFAVEQIRFAVRDAKTVVSFSAATVLAPSLHGAAQSTTLVVDCQPLLAMVSILLLRIAVHPGKLVERMEPVVLVNSVYLLPFIVSKA